MPPKVKITKEMVLNAAFEITRADGIEAYTCRYTGWGSAVS